MRSVIFATLVATALALPLDIVSRQDDLASILEALQANNPEDAAAAAAQVAQSATKREVYEPPSPDGIEPDEKRKRQDDPESIIAALLAEGDTEEAEAARAALNGSAPAEKRQDDAADIIAALEAESPEDAEAAEEALKG